MNIRSTLRVFVVLLFSLPTWCYSNLTVTFTKQPPSQPPWEVLEATVAGGSTTDPTPNPCYQRFGCHLTFFLIEADWYPVGRENYATLDYKGFDLPKGHTDSDYKTIGEFWSAVLDKGRVGQAYQYLNLQHKPPACMVIAGTNSEIDRLMAANTIVSNCAKVSPQVPGCKLEPGQINVTFNTAAGRDSGEQIVPGVRLSCTSAVDVHIDTNTAEEIPLGGDNTTVAVLDWGSGYGRPGVFNMAENESRPIPLKVKTRGIARLEPGSYSGSAIVYLHYE
ncbi:hypothetical protein [Erwinia persicina]|uniref:hypothetical protein n=1 Tax=Erwinia persicina TaxID=55211 RepID=UPI0017875BFF|nr:hypothetical protein [Erwinia persicina]MBD8162876.1 hypothetical protein [Erwinia persicina]